MKKIAISLAVAFVFLSLVVSTASATLYLNEEGKWKLLKSSYLPADFIGREVKVYLKELATGRPLAFSSDSDLGGVFRQGTLIAVTLKYHLVESDDLYYWIPVENIALIEVIK